MSDGLDRMLAELAAAPSELAFENIETAVLRRIGVLRQEARMVRELVPVRVASLVLALAMGVTTGAALAASAMLTPTPYAVLSSVGHFAPSTLLEGRH
ncbi:MULTISPECIES: hypothetical protein [unclassified Phenylobacterium]|jgi:hypothetical protein|uniref:hypothetical protein n=1 Tax=unclassified Phenylobacterium TaxID=2640670 RepID=UPI00083B877E|nr:MULTISPECIES: hypothetical protein [unclassified Phenylobacterium]